MPRVCIVSGKKTVFGRNRKHKAVGQWAYRSQTTPRRWLMNLKKVRVMVDGKVRNVRMGMKYYKKLRKDGIVKSSDGKKILLIK